MGEEEEDEEEDEEEEGGKKIEDNIVGNWIFILSQLSGVFTIVLFNNLNKPSWAQFGAYFFLKLLLIIVIALRMV